MAAIALPTARGLLNISSVRAFGATGNGTTDDTNLSGTASGGTFTGSNN